MWFAVSCMPSSNHSIGGILTRGRQKCDVTQTTQTCAYDALHIEEDNNVVLTDYRKITTARSSIDDFYLSRPSPVGHNCNDTSPDLPERTYNSSASSSGYHSSRELPHSNRGVTFTTSNNNSYVDLDTSPRVNRTFDENLLRKETFYVLRREKRPQNVNQRNSYHGNWDRKDCQKNSNRNSYHGHLDSPAFHLRENILRKNERNRSENVDKLHHSKSFSDFDSRELYKNSCHDSNGAVTYSNGWPVLYRYRKDREVSCLSPPAGRRNPMGVFSPGEHPRISSPNLRKELPLVPCQCDNEHCDYYWRRNSGGGNLETNMRNGYHKTGISNCYGYDLVSSPIQMSCYNSTHTVLHGSFCKTRKTPPSFKFICYSTNFMMNILYFDVCKYVCQYKCQI